MNILYHHRTQGGGAEGVHIREIASAFRSLGHEVNLVSPPGIDPFSQVTDSRGKSFKKASLRKKMVAIVPQFIFELMEIGYNVWACFRINRAVRGTRPDFIYERYAFFCLAGVSIARQLGIPIVLEVNEISGIKRQRPQTMAGLCGWFEKKIFAKADFLIVVSQFLKDQLLERGVAADKVVIIPNAVNLKQFDINIDSSGIRQAYALEGKVVLTFVGMFSKWDRLDFLVESFAKIYKQYPDSRLILVGDGFQLAALWQQAQDLGIADFIFFTGEVARFDIPYYIAASDICLLSGSNPFGSPIALFEYMAMAKPVVVPRYGPIECIVEDGKEGLLFEPQDGQRFVEAIGELIRDEGKRKEFGQNARKKILESYTWEKNAGRVVEIVKKSAVDGP